jgi:3-oxoacyl-[acyl-carrier-protein] synthase-3
MKAYIAGSGTYLPEGVVSNADLTERLGLSPEQIFKSSGIRNRRWASEGTTTSALAAGALLKAIDNAGLRPEQIDYLITGTMTPDRFIPGVAPAVQKLAGLREIPALDIRGACCNALYGLQVARALVLSGAAQCVAICLAEIQSAWLDLSPASGTISMLFGDGASALIVCSEETMTSEPAGSANLEIVDLFLATDGSYVGDLGIRAPGTEFGARAGTAADAAAYNPSMVGQSVILQASRKMVAACQTVLSRNSLTINDVSWLVPHQANANLLAQVGRALSFPKPDGLVSVIEDLGNTSSASMGIALDHLRRSGRIEIGEYLLLPAFGAGFTWGAALGRSGLRPPSEDKH